MISISTKGRYATRIMIRLSLLSKDRPVQKSAISSAEGISSDYIEQILIKLKAAGLVVSHRGARGGYTLAKPSGEISVADVVEATEGAVNLAPCLLGDCEKETVCVAKNVWRRANDALLKELSVTSIKMLENEAREVQSEMSVQYCI